jgi:uncharacterized membrane protein YoaK (UPF0700 family)
MISRLPGWAWAGAWVLAFMAGMINVVGLLGFEHQAVTHLTGTTSLLAVSLADLDFQAAIHLSAIIGSFCLGTVISGFIIQDSTLKLGRRYGAALFLEAILLSSAVPLLQHHNIFGFYGAACACGLQNAMVSTYSGAVVRTTHLSGMFTDLGILLGHAIRGLPVDPRRMRLYLLIISAFLLGGILGACCFRRMEYATLFIPSGLAALTSITYALYRAHLHQRERRAPG